MGERMRVTSAPERRPRVSEAERRQVSWVPTSLEDLLPSDHRARAIWDFVEGLDLSALYGGIRAVEGHAGRPPIDPKILVALWIYATVEGVGSARALERLCGSHDAYRWICGGVSVNHHTLSDFRSGSGEVLDRLLTESVASLMAEGLVTLRRVAQDGMRVRASAGAPSFRSERGLKRCLKEAREQVWVLRRELEEDPAATTRRQEAARERAARERVERVRRALRHREAAAKRKEERGRDKDGDGPRASTTDPEARVMKMADGGYRPAYNAQLATDTKTQVILAVDVTNAGSDMGQLAPMARRIETRYGAVPREMLVDGNFARLDDLRELAAAGCAVYAPVNRPRGGDRDPHRPIRGDDAAIAAWRRRMGTRRAKAIYRERGATAECVNAIARNRGLRHFLVRGLEKVRAVLLWFALAHNAMRALALRTA